ncbi:MAG: SDR family NAD(P)-dependent oxidoreductase, partial [Clostridia bacterium]|nr:SDR family NAD(P)-dependent oxidoreductase [Clostridia bacterium]
MGHLSGKTVLITGGGRAVLSDGRPGSIGYGIAHAYAKEGANIVITGRNVQKLQDAKDELEKLYGIKVLPVAADIAAGEDNAATVKRVVEETVA